MGVKKKYLTPYFFYSMMLQVMIMESKIRQGYLYDFYGELLNEHQRSIYEDFLFEDLSLAEIASEKEISRQAVHDVIKRCNKALEDYEDKLHLLEKFLHIKEDVEAIHLLTKEQSDQPTIENMNKIAQICSAILEEL